MLSETAYSKMANLVREYYGDSDFWDATNVTKTKHWLFWCFVSANRD